MKKKFLSFLITGAFMCIFPSFALAAAPTVETDGVKDGKTNFFANGTSITVEARTDGVEGAKIVWDGGSMLVGAKTYVFGGSHDSTATIDETNIVVNGGKLKSIFGGGLHKSYVKKANITVNGGTIEGVNGGGASSASWTTCHQPWYALDDINATTKVDETNVTINNGTITLAYGGGEGKGYVGDAYLEINGGDVLYATAGGSNGYAGNALLAVTGGKINVAQNVNRGLVKEASTVVYGGEIENLYVGGETTDAEVDGVIDSANSIILAGKVKNASAGTSGNVDIDLINDGALVFATDTVENLLSQAGTEIELVSLDKTSLEMKKGAKSKLNATLTPEEFSDNALVIWNSSDENVVTVDEEGNLVAVSAGTAEISATLGTKTIKCSVKVTEEKKALLDDVPKTSSTFPIALVLCVMLAIVSGSYALKLAKTRK